MKPGSRYLLSLQNTAGSATNLHTHGLHISGDGPADNIFRSLNPSSTSCLFYSFKIPNNHNSGTFWYHAHLHGSTSVQVGGGAFGILIIEDKRADNSYSDIPSSATINNPNLATFLSTEKLLFFSETKSQTGSIERRVNGMGPLTTTGTPQITLVANQWYRFRIAVSRPGFGFATNSVFNFPGECSVRQLSRDGIFLSSVPAPQSSSYSIAGPSRIDLAVRCTKPSQGNVDISWDTIYKVQLVINTGTPNTGFPFGPDGLSNWQPVRPAYLQDMRNVAVLQAHQITAGGSNMAWNSNAPIQFTGTNTPAIASLTFNGVYELRIFSFNAHPVHLHVYPMQMIGIWDTNTKRLIPGDCGTYKVGEFYDTVMASQHCVVRFRAIDFGGKVVVHCHRLSHEDAGAMAWINVTGDPNAIPQTPQLTAVPCTSFT